MLSSEFVEMFYRKLHLSQCSIEQQEKFLISVTRYLDHGRKEEINGRTLEYVERQLDKLLKFLGSIECTIEDAVTIMTNMPSLLNTVDVLYDKYLFLGVVENEENTYRKDKLVNKTKDFMVGLPKIYARYRLVCESGYGKANWNNLVHSSDKEFASIFICGKYNKSYQLFDGYEGVMSWLADVDYSDLDIEEIKHWTINKEIVEKYEGKSEENRRMY
ncbi:MAG: hypothetical protein K2H20_03650 [Bacilli bacterium]|nr:hypothetical protein [Bacilli bacterium]